MITSIIVAMGRSRVIGKDNRLPWRLREDLKHFKEITMGHTVVMGRKTHESIGQPLSGRSNIVISRNPAYRADGCTVVPSLEQALSRAAGQDEVFVIGGASVYAAALPLADRLYVTLIDHDFDGDAFFPSIDPRQWRETSRRSFDPQDGYRFSIVTYDRIRSAA